MGVGVLNMVRTEVDDDEHCVVLEESGSEDVQHGERDHVRTGGLEWTEAVACYYVSN